jgi:hypothetical protein
MERKEETTKAREIRKRKKRKFEEKGKTGR